MFKGRFSFNSSGLFRWGSSRLQLNVEVHVICDGKGEAPFQTITSIEQFPFVEIPVGHIKVTDKTTWSQLDNLVIKEFKTFYKSTYAYCGLGLTGQSIFTYEIGSMSLESEGSMSGASVLREPNDRNQPDKLPHHYMNTKEDVHRVKIYLRGAAQCGAIDALCFETLISKGAIEQYIDRLKTGKIIFCGPQFVYNKVYMGFVAKRVAEYFVVANRDKINCSQVAAFDAIECESNIDSLEKYLRDITVRCRAPNGKFSHRHSCSSKFPAPHVLLIENIQAITNNVNEVVCTLSELRTSTHDIPFVIGTFVTPMRIPRPPKYIPYGHGF